MAGNIVQINVSDALSPGNTYTPTNWVVPQAGSTVLMFVYACSANISLSPTIATPVLTGETWTVRGTGTNVTGVGTARTRAAPFSMNAIGGELAPAIALGNMTGAAASIRVICIEVNQIAGSPIDGSSGISGSTSTANPDTLSSSYTTATVPCTLVAVCVMYGVGVGTPTFAWGGTNTTFVDQLDTAYSGNIASSVAIAPAATITSYTASAVVTSSVAQACGAMYFIAFKDGNVTGASVFQSRSSMTASGVVPISGAVTQVSASVFGAAATESAVVAASFVSVSAMTGDSTVLRPAAVSMTSVSSFGGAATRTQSAAVGMASTSSLGAAATETLVSALGMVSASSMAATASASVPVALSMTSVSSLSATSTESLVSAVGMASVSSMTSNATPPSASAGFTSVSVFGSSTNRTQSATVGITSVSLFSGSANVGAGANLSAVSVSSFGAAASGSLVSQAGFVSASHFVSNAQPPSATSGFQSISTMGADGKLLVPGVVGFTSVSSLTAAGLASLPVSAAMVSLSSFGGSVTERITLAATWASVSSMTTAAPALGVNAAFLSINVFTADCHIGPAPRDITLCFQVGSPRWSTITGSGRWSLDVDTGRWQIRTEEPECETTCN